jgi:CRP-like cAMP-binding protein
MEIILEGTRMVDDGLIEKVGPVSVKQEDAGSSDASGGVPVVNGPMVDYMYVADEEDYADGTTIVKQGKHGNWSWVVLDGMVEIRKETPKGQLPIVRIGNGSFIGNVAALLVPGNVRSASVVAVGNVQLGVLDMQRLSMEYARLSSLFKTFIISLDKRVKQTTSRAVEIYSKKKSEVKSFMKGKTPLIKQGGSDDKIYLIEQGKAYIVRTTKKGHFLLSNLEDDDFIGRVPFFNIAHEPESASVFGSEDLELKEIDYEPLLAEYEKLSTTFKNMIENYSTFVSVTSMIASGQHVTAGKKKK